jgi:hypothetical protein
MYPPSHSSSLEVDYFPDFYAPTAFQRGYTSWANYGLPGVFFGVLISTTSLPA